MNKIQIRINKLLKTKKKREMPSKPKEYVKFKKLEPIE